MSEDELTVSGERPAADGRAENMWHETERAYGRFFRRVSLPVGAWPRRASATFQDGVLEVRVPIIIDDATELGPAWACGAARVSN
jgi:HSP20 family protein